MQVDIINIEGQKTGRTIELPEEIFGIEPNTHVVWLAVKQYLAAQRQGTAKVKTRAEAQGSSKKLHKQKGTGGSRKGNLRNPLYKGGGAIFGPKPRDYDFKLNRKVKDLAKISALSSKAKDNKIVVVEDTSLEMETPSTKSFVQMFAKFNNGSRKSLFVMPEYSENLFKSFRNVPSVCGTLLSDINTYDIVNADTLIFTESAAMIFVDDSDEILDAKEEETPVKAEPKAKKEKVDAKEAKTEKKEEAPVKEEVKAKKEKVEGKEEKVEVKAEEPEAKAEQKDEAKDASTDAKKEKEDTTE